MVRAYGAILGPDDPDGSTRDTDVSPRLRLVLDGRQVVVTWFGGYGIGANVWRDADVVFVCDDFYLPQRAIKATLQGLKGHKATEGFLATPTLHGAMNLSTCVTVTSFAG